MDDRDRMIHDALRFAADNRLPSLNPMLTIGNDTRTRQQRRHEERKGIREPDQDAAAQAKADADRRTDRKRSGVTAASIDRLNPEVWGGKLNIYTCEGCRAHIVTRDVAEGVTPFMLSAMDYCPNRCGQGVHGINRVMMTSSHYRVWDQSMREDYQWYAPDADETTRATPYQREHYSKGGLEIRKAVFDGKA